MEALPNFRTLYSINLKDEAIELKHWINTTKSYIQEKVEKIKENLPGYALLTTAIVGAGLAIGGGALEFYQINGFPYVLTGAAILGTSAFIATGLAKKRIG